MTVPPRAECISDLAEGGRALRRAFAAMPQRLAACHATLVGEAEIQDHAYLIRHGWAASSRTLPDGRRFITEIHLPGDVVGLSSLLRARSGEALHALTPLVHHPIARAELSRLVANRAVALALFDLLQRAGDRSRVLAALLAGGSAEERVASFLLAIYGRLRRRYLVAGLSFRLPMTQQEIGDHLGLTVVHVNRVLQRFGRKGIIAREGRTVLIRDPDRLIALAGKSGPVPDSVPAPWRVPASEPIAALRETEAAD